jgi:uncharacterized membrane protein YgdD (TMEM256/DUF423 family)
VDSDSDRVSRWILVTASILGAAGVLFGALGAHGIENILSQPGWHGPSALEAELLSRRIDQFNVGARYHLVHAAVLLALAAIDFGSPKWRLRSAGLFVAGILLFSGSLYLLVLTNTPWLGAVTPIGGVAWIIAWLTLWVLARSSPADPSGRTP